MLSICWPVPASKITGPSSKAPGAGRRRAAGGCARRHRARCVAPLKQENVTVLEEFHIGDVEPVMAGNIEGVMLLAIENEASCRRIGAATGAFADHHDGAGKGTFRRCDSECFRPRILRPFAHFAGRGKRNSPRAVSRPSFRSKRMIALVRFNADMGRCPSSDGDGLDVENSRSSPAACRGSRGWEPSPPKRNRRDRPHPRQDRRQTSHPGH